jgi:GMP synthase (glutamine-hydrolysing)
VKVHCLQHTSFETPGSILTWAKKHGAKFSITQTYLGEDLPDVKTIDLLIILGGPQSATELDKYPYLKAEVNFIQQAIDQQKAVMGICLGAQLIGEALGGRTEKSPHPEIGVFPMHLLPDAKHDPIFSKFPEKFVSAHWHSDMPGYVDGMTLLAGSEGCPRQAFRYGDRVYGLQCHFEMMKCNVEKLLDRCKDDILSPGLYIQEAELFLQADFDIINQKMIIILDYLRSKIS